MPEIERNPQVLERLRLLPQTSRDSLMGQLLRRFWHPIAISAKLAKGKAKAVRYFGEDLTLYRGASGRPYLIGGRCAHRQTVLHTGWVEGEEMRCVYHGWKYDGTGRCIEMPAEKGLLPNVTIAAYPVRDYGGLIFAYMGEAPAPDFDLPRKEAIERPGALLFQREQIWRCNWFQQVENSMDAAHVSFVHQKGRVGAFGAAVTPAVPELAYEETEAGVRQTATRGPDNVRVSDWTFPNNNHIVVPGLAKGDPWFDVVVWMVPNDDEHTTRFEIYAGVSTDPDTDRRITGYFDSYSEYNPADHHDELFHHDTYPADVLVQLTAAQDYVAQVGQGVVADRAQERLGRSDAGVALLRRVFLRELDAVAAERPGKPWRRLAHAPDMPVRA